MKKTELNEKLQVADRVLKLPIYVFSEVAEQKKLHDPEWLIDLSLGSPDLPTPVPVMECLRKSVEVVSNHGYPPFDGKDNLTQEIAKWFENRFGVKTNKSNVLPLIGSKEGLAHLPLVYINPGDISLIPDPHYPVHHRGSVLAGAEIYSLPLKQENDFLPDLAAIPPDIANKAKIIIISYPNNPTGAVSNPEFMRELVAFCRKYNILLCHDLAYSEIGFDGPKPQSIFEYISFDEPAIEFFTFSKTYHMAGWRIGFCVGNKEVVNNLYSLKTNMDYGIFGAIQDAAVEALKLPEPYYNDLKLIYKNRVDLVHSRLTEAFDWDIFKAKGGMYLWLPVPEKFEGFGRDFAIGLLKNFGVVTTPGIAFGKEGRDYVRLAMVQSEDKLIEASERIIKYVKGLI